MTGIFRANAAPGRSKCARCGRRFTPKKEGDKYGPECAKIVAAQQHLESVGDVRREAVIA